MREIFAADKKADHRPALQRSMIADRSLEHWVFRFQCVEDGADSCRTIELELHFVADASQSAQVMRKDDANHAKNPKSQNPSSKEAPTPKLQSRVPTPVVWSLVIGISSRESLNFNGEDSR